MHIAPRASKYNRLQIRSCVCPSLFVLVGSDSISPSAGYRLPICLLGHNNNCSAPKSRAHGDLARRKVPSALESFSAANCEASHPKLC